MIPTLTEVELTKPWIFSLVLTCAFVFILAVMVRRLKRLEQERIERLHSVDEFVAVEPKKASKGRVRRARERGIASLERRFTIIRRMLVAFGAITVAVVAIITFSDSVPASVVSLVAAAATVVLGIAARPVVENFICGIVLTLSRNAYVGDTVLVDNNYGSIEDITPTHTIVRMWDALRYVIPNTSMVTKSFINYNLRDDLRWLFVEFSIDYKTDLDQVGEIARSAPEGSPYYSDREPPQFWVTDMRAETIRCMVVAWASTPSDGWMLSMHIRERLIRGFQKEGIQTHNYRVSPVSPDTGRSNHDHLFGKTTDPR